MLRSLQLWQVREQVAFLFIPTEALHGDLGMMNDKDMVIAISYSGESQEITTILPHLRRLSIEIIAMCANTTSTLAKQADIVLSIAVKQEACPLNIAPTASTTVTLALGDALSVALMRAKSFAKEDFASFHPGGSLGKRLFVKAADLMICNDLPIANQHTPLQEAIITMSHHRLGILLLINEQHQLVGTLSDGDLRRAMMCEDFALSNAVSTYMSRSPKTSQNVNMLAIEALELIEQYKIQVLLFTNEQKQTYWFTAYSHLSRSGYSIVCVLINLSLIIATTPDAKRTGSLMKDLYRSTKRQSIIRK